MLKISSIFGDTNTRTLSLPCKASVGVALPSTRRGAAARLAQHVRHSDWAHASHWHCSDLKRALQTAQPLVEDLHRLQAESNLREQGFGIFEGKSVDELQRDEATLWAQWRCFDADFELPGGESTRRFHARVMQHLAHLAEQHRGERLVVVTHGGVLDMVWRSVHGLDLSGYRQCQIPNTGLNHVAWQDGVWRILDWARVDHLAGLPPQPVYQTTSA